MASSTETHRANGAADSAADSGDMRRHSGCDHDQFELTTEGTTSQNLDITATEGSLNLAQGISQLPSTSQSQWLDSTFGLDLSDPFNAIDFSNFVPGRSDPLQEFFSFD